jgi:hypothetical protein
MSYKLAGVTWNDDGSIAVSMPPFKALSHLTYRAAMDNDTTVVECLEWYNIVAAELEALDIIKTKGVNVFELRFSFSLEEYNICKGEENKELTQKEYETLKKVLL